LTNDFRALGVAEPILRALDRAGFVTPTPIQAQAIPPLLDDFDMLGIAQTGTGKTAAFALPIVQHLAEDRVALPPKGVRALILAPTRELAIQIDEQVRLFARELKLRSTVIFGGVGQVPQQKALAQGCEIVVATPGRLLDLLQQRLVRLDTVTHLVLDEADRMLDMGFIRDVTKIIKAVPLERQTMLFSATMPAAVATLAQDILYEPVRVEVTPEVVTVEKIAQTVIHVPANAKRSLLVKLLEDAEMDRVVVFTRTKHGANKVAEHLEKAGVSADAIHGNKSQSARQRALSGFKSGEVRVLVATDIAARGIDVQGISHVVNFELPDEPESYVHRIGRTARAGRGGSAVAFCDPGERDQLRQIERLIKRPIPVGQVEGFVPPPPGQAEPERAERRFGGRGRGGGRGRNQRRAA
jgi:ATP-dependent RNA helicase RhlE